MMMLKIQHRVLRMVSHSPLSFTKPTKATHPIHPNIIVDQVHPFVTTGFPNGTGPPQRDNEQLKGHERA